jgi:hypothetical protein
LSPLTSSEVASRAVSPASRFLPASRNSFDVCRQSISDSWLGNLREYLAHLV